MTKKITNYLLILPCILFIVWYFTISYYNVFACDDFWHGQNVVENGFWKAQMYYWYNWEGSYTHTFFATLPHIFDYSKIPFIFNLLSFGLLYFSIYFFIRTFFNLTPNINRIITLYIIAFFYTLSLGDAEIRFWVCANITYLLGIATILLFLSIYHTWSLKSYKEILVLIFLIFLVAGNKIPFIFVLGVCIILHDYISAKISFKRTGCVLIILILFSLLNFLAPGNFIRLSLNISESYNYSVIDVLYIRLLNTLSFMKWGIILVPVSLFFHKYLSIRTLIIYTFTLVLIFLGDTLVMYICFHDPGPLRSYVIIEFSCIAYLLVLFNYIYLKISKTPKSIYIVISFCAIVIFSYESYVNIAYINESISYSKLSTERNNRIKDTPNNSEICISPLPQSGLLLSYFCNDEEWLQFVYIPYFQKDIYITIDTQNN